MARQAKLPVYRGARTAWVADLICPDPIQRFVKVQRAATTQNNLQQQQGMTSNNEMQRTAIPATRITAVAAETTAAATTVCGSNIDSK